MPPFVSLTCYFSLQIHLHILGSLLQIQLQVVNVFFKLQRRVLPLRGCASQCMILNVLNLRLQMSEQRWDKSLAHGRELQLWERGGVRVEAVYVCRRVDKKERHEEWHLLWKEGGEDCGKGSVDDRGELMGNDTGYCLGLEVRFEVCVVVVGRGRGNLGR